MMETSQTAFLGDEARKYEYDRWLAALFTPAATRGAVFTLLAFNGEVSRIRETVTEPLLGDIRLQWWRDAIADLSSGKTLDHPVVRALSSVMSDHDLMPDLFLEIINARSQDLDPHPLASVEDLQQYADGVGGNLHSLLYSVLAPGDPAGDAAARAMGTSFALTGIIRAIPFHARQDLLLIPADILARHGLTSETVFVAENKNAFLAAVHDLTRLAEEAHEKSDLLIKARPTNEKPVYKLSALTEIYLKRLQKSGFDPAHGNLEVGRLRKIAALLLA
jgi:phytoene synthase